ncbi:TIM barrel protein [Nocardioides marmoribigeumensis]|uniref:Hydroxypyruvate isomerase n=1 Tax=Nocardioides marmoribigeumensis TaxID=433649 RepID=A0ABU2BUW8_9ACTN|nr:TIM barrel protein [Nocardioides marmoribigeumensis]MDR7362430.1 hydroxypyruvate isomerase [Nocardioides marmoribigeumensis]
MLRSISIQLMWTDRPHAERVEAAAAAGFDLVDLWDRRDSDLDGVAETARRHGVGVNGFFGNRDHSLCDPDDVDAAIAEIAENLDAAVRAGARQLHLFSNAIRPGGVVAPLPELDRAELISTGVRALRTVAPRAAEAGVQLVLEHLNTVFLPGYLWDEVAVTTEVAQAVDHPSVGVVFDVFHQQLVRGRLTDNLVACLPWLVRVDIAQVPDRAEPGLGEVDLGFLRDVLARHGWDGTMTFEIVPSDGDPATAVKDIDRLFPKVSA